MLARAKRRLAPPFIMGRLNLISAWRSEVPSVFLQMSSTPLQWFLSRTAVLFLTGYIYIYIYDRDHKLTLPMFRRYLDFLQLRSKKSYSNSKREASTFTILNSFFTKCSRDAVSPRKCYKLKTFFVTESTANLRRSKSRLRDNSLKFDRDFFRQVY